MASRRGARLAAQSEPLDEHAVALDVLLAEVAELPAAAPDELEQPAPRVVVVRVLAEVIGEPPDALGQQRDLHLRRTGVSVMRLVVADDLLPTFRGDERGDASWSCSLLPIATYTLSAESSRDRAAAASPSSGIRRMRAPSGHADTLAQGSMAANRSHPGFVSIP